MNHNPEGRKCHGCSTFFLPDYRNRDRQQYCGKPDCQRASKAASQKRWLRKPANRDYFRDAQNVARVQQWRKTHPGYWRKKSGQTAGSKGAQPVVAQWVNPGQSSCNVPGSPLSTLQDFCLAKDPAFIGLISMVTGRTLPEDIAAMARRVIDQGRNILGVSPEQHHTKPCPDYDLQTSSASGSVAANPGQL
jgi:hypothetical protein